MEKSAAELRSTPLIHCLSTMHCARERSRSIECAVTAWEEVYIQKGGRENIHRYHFKLGRRHIYMALLHYIPCPTLLDCNRLLVLYNESSTQVRQNRHAITPVSYASSSTPNITPSCPICKMTLEERHDTFQVPLHIFGLPLHRLPLRLHGINIFLQLTVLLLHLGMFVCHTLLF